MTAIAIVRTEGGIAFATDGIAYDQRGHTAAIVCKTALFPEWSCVIANRGSALATARMQFGLQRLAYSGVRHLTGFDDVLAVLPDASRVLHEEILREQNSYPNFSFMIAGYSAQRDRFESYSLRSRDFSYEIGGKNMLQPAYTLGELPAMHFAPTPSKESAARVGMPAPGEPILSAESLAIQAICAARLDRGATPDAPMDEDYSIGGFVHLTTLHRTGIASEIVHRWPDVIGQPINPHREELLIPAYLAG